MRVLMPRHVATKTAAPHPCIVKIPSEMAQDLEELRKRMGASTATETVRQSVRRQLAILRELEQARTVQIRGRNPKGTDTWVLLT